MLQSRVISIGSFNSLSLFHPDNVALGTEGFQNSIASKLGSGFVNTDFPVAVITWPFFSVGTPYISYIKGCVTYLGMQWDFDSFF